MIKQTALASDIITDPFTGGEPPRTSNKITDYRRIKNSENYFICSAVCSVGKALGSEINDYHFYANFTGDNFAYLYPAEKGNPENIPCDSGITNYFFVPAVIKKAYAAFGYECIYISNAQIKKDYRSVMNAVKDSVDRGVPVFAWGMGNVTTRSGNRHDPLPEGCLIGGYGENGALQGVLEMFRIPYTGSGVLASALGMDKWRSKLLWQSLGLPVPECRRLDADSDFAAVEQALGLPLFVKPASEGSSVGVVKVKESGALAAAYAQAARSAPPGDTIIAERGIVDGEYTVAILGETALPIIRIEPDGEFYDYHAKYVSEKTRYLCPCELPPEREAQLREQALAAFAAIGGRGWGRVDFLCDAAGKAYFLEANTVPGMTTHSLVPMAARTAGIDFDTLVLSILARASLE